MRLIIAAFTSIIALNAAIRMMPAAITIRSMNNRTGAHAINPLCMRLSPHNHLSNLLMYHTLMTWVSAQ
jgi:hypothetical protein